MREIKFRGMSKTKKWEYGFLDFKPFDSEFCIHVVEDIAPNYQEPGGDIYSEYIHVIPESIGQFTGLKDKNGKEIYEGDVISGYGGKPICPIVFKNGSFNWDGYPLGLDLDALKETPTQNWATVIGNIYENPELLAREKEAKK